MPTPVSRPIEPEYSGRSGNGLRRSAIIWCTPADCPASWSAGPGRPYFFSSARARAIHGLPPGFRAASASCRAHAFMLAW